MVVLKKHIVERTNNRKHVRKIHSLFETYSMVSPSRINKGLNTYV